MKKMVPALVLVLGMIGAQSATAADIEKGKAIFNRWCWGCHTSIKTRVGYDVPAGTYRLQERYKGALPAALEERTDLSPAFIKATVRSGINMMPPTRKTEISDSELDDLAAYLTRNNK